MKKLVYALLCLSLASCGGGGGSDGGSNSGGGGGDNPPNPPGPSDITLNGKYVLSGDFGAITNSNIMTSKNSILALNADNSWKQMPLGSPLVYSYVFAKDRFVAMGDKGPTGLLGEKKPLFSDDGINWYPASSTQSNYHYLSYTANTFFDTHDNMFITGNAKSTDGLTWEYFDNNAKTPTIYGNNRYLTIINYSGYYSFNAQEWLPMSTKNLENYKNLFFNGQDFIAANADSVYSDNPPMYNYSKDGSNWSQTNYPIIYGSYYYRTSCDIKQLNGSFFCYLNINESSQVATSIDGINWSTPQVLDLNDESKFNSSTPIFVNNKYYAYCGGDNTSGSYRTCTSNDGITWNYFGDLPALVTSGNNIQKDGYINTQQNGKVIGETLTYHYGKYFLFGPYGKIWYSTDNMQTWTQTVSGITVSNYNTFHNTTGLAFVLGYTRFDSNKTQAAIAYSNDNAASFKMANLPEIAKTPRAIASSGHDYVVVGDAGTVLHSSDGINWSQVDVSNITTSDLTNVEYLNGKYYATGDLGYVLTSSNGINWTYSQAAGNPRLMDIIYNNGKYFVVGYGGYIGYSLNGTNWIKANTPTREQINSVTFGNGIYIAVGNNGTLISSINGVTWTQIPANNIKYSSSSGDYPIPTGNMGTLNSIIYDSEDGFVAVGDSGLVIKSSDGVNWLRNYNYSSSYSSSSYNYTNITPLN